MKILLVYPKYPDTFWSFKHVLKFVSKKAAFPPLGLITIGAMLPESWEKKLVDMNVAKLNDKDIKWADFVFISAMITQKQSAKEVIERCNKLGVKVVAGGPVFTTGHDEFEGVDHFVLGEAEDIMNDFLEDLQAGCAKRIYVCDSRPDIARTPIPLWNLINVKQYVSMSVQYSRGCPYDCEFCDVIIMNGRIPRPKTVSQFLAELDAIYGTGFRGSVFVVDDNFIGNKGRVKEMLPELIRWQKERGYPFDFATEASLNLSDDENLMRMMAKAGFNKVFIGLETPAEASLAECNKFQNKGRDMAASVKKIQNHGMHPLGGFIVGFDNDPLSIFTDQINFIQKTGIVIAMVGILQALPKTKLHSRLEKEGRLLEKSSGNNTDGSLGFIPRMDAGILVSGYKKIIQTIYSPKKYYERLLAFLKEYRPLRIKRKLQLSEIQAFLKSIWYLGLAGGWQRMWYYWKAVFLTFFKYRKAFPEVIIALIYGMHFQKVVDMIVKSPCETTEKQCCV